MTRFQMTRGFLTPRVFEGPNKDRRAISHVHTLVHFLISVGRSFFNFGRLKSFITVQHVFLEVDFDGEQLLIIVDGINVLGLIPWFHLV